MKSTVRKTRSSKHTSICEPCLPVTTDINSKYVTSLCLFFFLTPPGITHFSHSTLADAPPRPYHVLAIYEPVTRACEIIDQGRGQIRRDLGTAEVAVELRPRVIDHHYGPHGEAKELLMDIVGMDEAAVRRELGKRCGVIALEDQEGEDLERPGELVWQQPGMEEGWGKNENDQTEVRKIVDSGAPGNRIDVVLMGDGKTISKLSSMRPLIPPVGYTLAEKSKFFADMERLTRDMFVGQTYRSTLPLFNIWAVYRPSAESGIGVGGSPRDTAFGLYRDGTELRGIYCSKPREARAACKAAGKDACDFPSLIGNDAYYGGLGGEFTISTSSETSGTVVLRHEMGHNFINVGEEYDGGYVYSGCNAARSVGSLGWKHWLTGPPREELNVLRVQDYSWYDLGKGPYRISFQSDGRWSRWYMQISASGVETEGALEVLLDGTPLLWKTSNNLDRVFSSWFEQDHGLEAGEHVLEFRQTSPPADPSGPIRQLCSVTLHEYTLEDKYVFSNDHVSAYPSFSIDGRKTFRPTNEGCLMRNMSQTTLCPVCQEGLWHQLLRKVTLIDGVRIQCEKENVTIRVDLVPLAQLRAPEARIEEEKYFVTWRRQGIRQVELDDQFGFERELGQAWGEWKVMVEFVTPQVRVDPKGLLMAEQKFTINGCKQEVETFKSW
ncbi:IgA peptidase M64-domain-containing protein [Endogone sp. FLAS-F59071]|nr:IgA peptidase M64-domain-containing protein [Endogone sp. FLAS-F59071]|eukprot:RUS21350.1 IgA peptidase M64-domain-containing protein [Endogone sp. FLAS-F59071]